MTSQGNQIQADESMRKVVLNKRLEDFGWGAILITIGTIGLVPEKQVPHGSWLIVAGLIMLGINAIRYFNGIKMSGFSLVVGILALLAGVGKFLGLNLPLFAIALIVIGVCMLLKPLLEKDSISPTGNAWCCCGQGEPESNQQSTRGQAVGR
jgi:drug/metabolite transporter (DMT)-like permease